jgi:hypothetical protein
MEPLEQAWPAEEVATWCNHGLFSQVRTDITLKAEVAVTGAIHTLLLSPFGFYPHVAYSKEL